MVGTAPAALLERQHRTRTTMDFPDWLNECRRLERALGSPRGQEIHHLAYWQNEYGRGRTPRQAVLDNGEVPDAHLDMALRGSAAEWRYTEAKPGAGDWCSRVTAMGIPHHITVTGPGKHEAEWAARRIVQALNAVRE